MDLNSRILPQISVYRVDSQPYALPTSLEWRIERQSQPRNVRRCRIGAILPETAMKTALWENPMGTDGFEFIEYAASHREWYIDATIAPELIRSSKFLQNIVNDTSVHLYDGQILCTSHSIRYHAGIDMRVDDLEIRDRARELAAYLSGLCRDQADGWAADETFVDQWEISSSRPMDTKFESFYESTFTGLALPESMALTMLSCQVNTAMLLGRLSRHVSAGSVLAFKFRYASVWQVLKTLRTISANDSPFGFAPGQCNELIDLLDTDGPRYMAGRGCRSLRNTIVHYGTRYLAPSDIQWDDPLLGLPQKFCDGQSWSELDSLIDRCAEQVQTFLDHWRGPFTHLLNEPPDG